MKNHKKKGEVKCPCKSGINYSSCCQPCHRDHQQASTPEKLMRSRYSAFVFHLDEYLLKTWITSKRPTEIKTRESGISWLHLTVESSSEISKETHSGTVTFTAVYTDSFEFYTLHEKSNFIQKNSCWFYYDGEPVTEKLILSKNGPCFCNSGKKFKRCCGK